MHVYKIFSPLWCYSSRFYSMCPNLIILVMMPIVLFLRVLQLVFVSTWLQFVDRLWPAFVPPLGRPQLLTLRCRRIAVVHYVLPLPVCMKETRMQRFIRLNKNACRQFPNVLQFVIIYSAANIICTYTKTRKIFSVHLDIRFALKKYTVYIEKH